MRVQVGCLAVYAFTWYTGVKYEIYDIGRILDRISTHESEHRIRKNQIRVLYKLKFTVLIQSDHSAAQIIKVRMILTIFCPLIFSFFLMHGFRFRSGTCFPE